MEKGSPNNLGAGRLQILLRFSGWENGNFVSLAHLRELSMEFYCQAVGLFETLMEADYQPHGLLWWPGSQ